MQVAALMVGNLQSFPFVYYFAYIRVNAFCKRVDTTFAQAAVLVVRVMLDILLGSNKLFVFIVYCVA